MSILVVYIFAETIENDELEDYIEEILFNEFDTMAEDGSLPKVRGKLPVLPSGYFKPP